MSDFVAPSVRVLRSHGPLSLREVTAQTARLLEASVNYADVLAVLEREQRAGLVVPVGEDDGDFRDRIWRATDPETIMHTGTRRPLTPESFRAHTAGVSTKEPR